MKPIRTLNGKLFGMLDVAANVLHIKDGANVRLIQVPPSGLTLQYITGCSQPETVYILPQS